MMKNHTSVIGSSINIAIKHENELENLNARMVDMSYAIEQLKNVNIDCYQQFNMAIAI